MTMNVLNDNVMCKTDSYKVTHHRQLPPGATRTSAFFESRGGRYPETIFFGLQYILKRHFEGVQVTEDKIAEAREISHAHFGSGEYFNEAGWRYILEKHGGRLPVEIRAVPEGTRVPVSNALVTVENTDPYLARRTDWLTGHLETVLSQVWYPMTVATQSYYMKQTILWHLEKSGTPADIDFKLHDFGYRGSTSDESAAIGGAAHLVNFKGTDTLTALLMLRRCYGEAMAGFSIPAAEHSTITSWGRTNEGKAYKNMLEQYPRGLVAVVSDSYDIFRAVRELWGDELKKLVLERDGVLIIRPDSGEPTEVLPKVLAILAECFGSTVNAKGYRVLHPKVRLIQGDGIDHLSVEKILQALEDAGWSSDNIAFGSGGGLLQKLDRDTQKCAFKQCAIEIGGVWYDVMKDPITDPGKRSKAGRLALTYDPIDGYRTVLQADALGRNIMPPVYRNGYILVDQKFADIRVRAAA